MASPYIDDHLYPKIERKDVEIHLRKERNKIQRSTIQFIWLAMEGIFEQRCGSDPESVLKRGKKTREKGKGEKKKQFPIVLHLGHPEHHRQD